jgi:hypothetical protein
VADLQVSVAALTKDLADTKAAAATAAAAAATAAEAAANSLAAANATITQINNTEYASEQAAFDAAKAAGDAALAQAQAAATSAAQAAATALADAQAAATAAATAAAAELAAANAAAAAAATAAAAVLAAANAAAATAAATAAAELATANTALTAANATITLINDTTYATEQAAFDAGKASRDAEVAALNTEITALKNPAGGTFALTTSASDVLIGTAGSDTFTGVQANYADTDLVVDGSTTDSDTYNLSLTSSLTPTPKSVNVANVNVTISNVATGGGTVVVSAAEMNGVSNLTVSRTDVTVGGSSIAGGKQVEISNVNSTKVAQVTAGVATTNLTVTQATKAGVTVNADAASGNVTVTGAATVSATGSGAGDTVEVKALNNATEDAKVVSITTGAEIVKVSNNTGAFTGLITVAASAATDVIVANAAGGVTISATGNKGTNGTNGITVDGLDDTGGSITTTYVGTSTNQGQMRLGGSGATTDAATVSAAGQVNLVSNNTDQVDVLNLSGNGAAATYFLTATAASTNKTTLTGSQDITISAGSAAITGTTITDSTAGNTTLLDLTTVAATNLAKVSVDSVRLSAAASGTVTVATGANLQVAKDQTTLTIAGSAADAVVNIATADDTSADGSTIDIAFTTALVASTNVKTVNLTASVGKVTAAATTLGTAGTLNVAGTKDVNLGNITALAVNAASFSGKLTLDTANVELTTITGGSGADSITVDQNVAYTIDAGAGGDTVTLSDVAAGSAVVGGAGNDTVNVNDEAAIVVTADDGDDTVKIGANIDSDAVLSGGGGTDTLTFLDTDGNAFDGNTNFSFVGFETLNVAALTSGSISVDNADFNRQSFTLKGDAAADNLKIVGTSSADTIDASTITVDTASVTLDGGAGNDVMTGTASADTLIGGVGSDTLSGGDSNDAVSYAGAADNADTGTQTGVVVNLSSSSIAATTILGQMTTSFGYTAGSVTTVASNTTAYLYGGTTSTNSAAVDTLLSIENVTGTDGNDYIVGSTGVNVIDGASGDDYINAGLGADTITGGAGNDTIVLTETTAAADTLIFGSNATNNGNDTITGFIAATDKINLDALTADVSTTAVAGALTTTAGKVYFLASTGTNADTAAAAATALSAAATFTDANATAFIVITDANSTSVFQWIDTAASGDEVATAELTFMGTIDAVLTTGDILFG